MNPFLRGVQERRRAEENYVQGLKRLAIRLPEISASEYGYVLELCSSSIAVN